MFGINDNKTDNLDPVGAPLDQSMHDPLMPALPAVDAPLDGHAAGNPIQTAGAPLPELPKPPAGLPAAPGPPPTTGRDKPADDELLKIKQQALLNLTPLIGKLDQTPEEKFKTTMMMLQASDNAQLVNAAYEAANKIVDEKARAQALLDVVNEINYFTHHSDAPTP